MAHDKLRIRRVWRGFGGLVSVNHAGRGDYAGFGYHAGLGDYAGFRYHTGLGDYAKFCEPCWIRGLTKFGNCARSGDLREVRLPATGGNAGFTRSSDITFDEGVKRNALIIQEIGNREICEVR